MDTNKDVRLAARGQGVPLWKLATALNVSEPTLTRRLRVPLQDAEKAKYLQLIKELAQRG